MYFKIKNALLRAVCKLKLATQTEGVHRHVYSCEINSRYKVYINEQFKLQSADCNAIFKKKKQKPRIHGSELWFVLAGGSVTRHSLKHHIFIYKYIYTWQLVTRLAILSAPTVCCAI